MGLRYLLFLWPACHYAGCGLSTTSIFKIFLIFAIVVACTLGLIILYGTYLGTEVYGVQGDYDDIAIIVEIIMVFQVLYNLAFKIIYQLTCRTLIEEEQDFGNGKPHYI